MNNLDASIREKKWRFKKSEIERVPEPYKEIVKIADPIQFIDLLCANHYFAGQFDGKIPVDQARTVFTLWLAKHDTHQLKALASALPEERRVDHDRCTWIDNGRCMAHKVKLTDEEIGVIFYENPLLSDIHKLLEGKK